ncbi:MAG: hypothetical protein RLP44_18495 [Aggregatilineales bacterium]
MNVENTDFAEGDPRYHATRIENQLGDLITQLRDDMDKFNDPKAQALFETAAEVLSGLQSTFRHYEQKSEDVWIS